MRRSRTLRLKPRRPPRHPRPHDVAVEGRAGARMRLHILDGTHPPDPYAGIFAARLGVRRGDRVLDIGCGAGLYAIAAAARGARVVATDIDRDAVAVTLANAARNGLPGAIDGRVGSMFRPVRGERFDLIVATLPQLPAPRPVIRTRYGGPDGLRMMKALARDAPRYLRSGGRVLSLVTAWADPDRVARLFERRGFAVRRLCRVERAFQPKEYEDMTPGLFAYLRDRARKDAYRRAGSWLYLRVWLLEARLTRAATVRAASRTHASGSIDAGSK